MNTDIENPIVGAVVIGRNEGERLQRCLHSLIGRADTLIYVDSGSRDGSVEFAKSLGVGVVALDTAIPFTAARARNAGYDLLLELRPDVEFVQFVDGDCEVAASWWEQSLRVMDDKAVAVVFGRRRERFPDASIYNTLCDIEWDTPPGLSLSCGGDALMRVAAFNAVQGYNASLIAGEEPELCVRLRRVGWKIWRADAEMTLHDANMMHFSQWWKRAMRAGHAYAEGSCLHGASAEQHWVKETRSNWFWGLSFPAILLAAMMKPVLLVLLALYPLQMWRIYQNSCLHRSHYERKLFAVFCVVAKLPLLLGQLKFSRNRLLGQKSKLIEYK
jgi:glycosyltransferase involved in cell wall biosynthesis